nr:hypothetical protein [uncultured Campylobacter sp.]
MTRLATPRIRPVCRAVACASLNKTDEGLCERLNTPTVPLARELKNVAKRSFSTSPSATAPPKNSSHKINLTAKTANNAAQNARLRCKLYTK